MPIDLVIDERDGTKPPELGGSTNGDGGTRSNADSTSHTDGASTPDVVSASQIVYERPFRSPPPVMIAHHRIWAVFFIPANKRTPFAPRGGAAVC